MYDLEHASRVEVLITRVRFAAGRSNGSALALMVSARKKSARVIFVAHADVEKYVADQGVFMRMPVAIPDLLAEVRRQIAAAA
jgi:hypothetical protein